MEKEIFLNAIPFKISLAAYNQHFITAEVSSDRFVDLDRFEVETTDRNIVRKAIGVIKLFLDMGSKTIWVPTKEYTECTPTVIEFIDKYIVNPFHFISQRIKLGDSIKRFIEVARHPLWYIPSIEQLLNDMHSDLPSLVSGCVIHERTKANESISYNMEPSPDKLFKECSRTLTSVKNACYTPIKVIFLDSEQSDIPLGVYQYLQYQCIHKGQMPKYMRYVSVNGFDYQPLYQYLITSPQLYQLPLFKDIVINNIDVMFTEFEIREAGLLGWSIEEDGTLP